MDAELDRIDPSLATALKETLERRGALSGIKAKIRSELYSVIDHSDETREKASSARDFLINELVRDYLLHRRLTYTVSVFTPESGQPEIPLDRSLLARELGIMTTDAKFKELPLLYTLISKVHPRGTEFFDFKRENA